MVSNKNYIDSSSTTVVYKGWLSISRPERNKDTTVILSKNKFFYRPKNHVLTESIYFDVYEYGRYVNVRLWANKKQKNIGICLNDSWMGRLNVKYQEISNINQYLYSRQFLDINEFNLLDHLTKFNGQYCVIEITYNKSEFDMISHEAELILLTNEITE
jgi:hypothetical protein